MPHYDESRGLLAGISSAISTAVAALINSGTLPAWFTNAKVTTALGVGNTTPSATGAGVSFPAVQSPSSDANTLDDYEEGTWTPSVGGTATYTTQNGTYTKIGNSVHVQGTLTINVIGTGSQSTVSGLPYAAASTAGLPVGGTALNYFNALASPVVFIATQVSAGGTTFIFNTLAAAAASATNGPNILTSGSRINFAFTYLAA